MDNIQNKAGRPKMDRGKSRRNTITLRLTDDEYERIILSIPVSYNANQSAWIRKVLLWAADNANRITEIG